MNKRTKDDIVLIMMGKPPKRKIPREILEAEIKRHEALKTLFSSSKEFTEKQIESILKQEDMYIANIERYIKSTYAKR